MACLPPPTRATPAQFVDSIEDGLLTSTTYRLCTNVTLLDEPTGAPPPSSIIYFSHDTVLAGNPRPGDVLELELEPLHISQNEPIHPDDPNDRGVVRHVMHHHTTPHTDPHAADDHGHSHAHDGPSYSIQCADSAGSGAQPPYETCASIVQQCQNPTFGATFRANCPLTCGNCASQDYYYPDIRQVRPLALIAELADGMTCDYLGSTREAREIMAWTDGAATSIVIRQSSFGKMFLNETLGAVLTIPVSVTAADLNVNQATECQTSEAYNRLGEIMNNNLPAGYDLANFDSIIHYYPEQLISQYCAVGGWSYDGTVVRATCPTTGHAGR